MQTQVGVSDTTGILRLINGCLAFEKSGASKTILWQKFHAPDLTDPKRVGVMSRYTGDTVFTGEQVVISGHQPGISAQVMAANNNPAAWAKVANDTDGACPPPYEMVASLMSLKEVRRTRIEARVNHHMKTFKMSREDAVIEARRLEGIADELSALVKDLRKNQREVIAGAWLNVGSAHSLVASGFGDNSPSATSLFVKGEVDKGSLIPSHLMEFVHVQPVPRSLAEGDKDIAFLQEKLGDSADIKFNFFEGTISIDNVTDLKPLSNLRISMGEDWPEHYKISLLNNAALNNAAQTSYFGPTSILGRYEMQQRPEYKKILEYAENRFPQAGYHHLDQAVLTLIGYGLTELEKIDRLETLGFGPLTAQLDFQAFSRKIKPAVFAEAIVTAEPVAINTHDNRKDGYRSTVTFKVKDYIKGPLMPGQKFKLHMKSGEDENGRHIQARGEPFLLPGFQGSFADHKDWILFLSNRAYRSKATTRDAKGEPLWGLSDRALPGRDDQYPWFGEVLSPEHIRKRVVKMEAPENLMAYAGYISSRARPPRGACRIEDGLPKEGLGDVDPHDVMGIELSYKTNSLGCDHAGPQNQECYIEDGGYITWAENGQRRHIKAKGGDVDVLLLWKKGAQCVDR